MTVRAPKVNHHVNVFVFVDASTPIRVKPGTITAIALDDAPVVRSSRGCATTYGDGTTGVPLYDHTKPFTETVYTPK